MSNHKLIPTPVVSGREAIQIIKEAFNLPDERIVSINLEANAIGFCTITINKHIKKEVSDG